MAVLNPSVRLVRSKNLPNPNRYVEMMRGEFSDWVTPEDLAPTRKGRWRQDLGLTHESPVDLEIGTGNGYFFAHYGKSNPDRYLLGMELKFKPLIQSMKRSLAAGNKNTRMVRYHAGILPEIFESGELNRVLIYFPDPWPKKRHHKNRLISTAFLETVHRLQRPGSYLEIKTDHAGYFDWIEAAVKNSPYRVSRNTRDLHSSAWAADNYVTHFEKLWTSQGLPTHLIRLECE